MKIVCDNCATKYSIADEKVSGKVFKLRCKKCSHVIVVKGNGEGDAASQEAAPAAAAPSPEPAGPEPAAAAAPDAVWHLVIDREQVGPMTAEEVRGKFAAGQIDADSYIWKEGFDDWLKLSTVDEFRSLAPQQPAPESQDQATRRSDPADLFRGSPDDEPAPGADLFNGGAAAHGGVTAAPNAQTIMASGPAPSAPYSASSSRPSGPAIESMSAGGGSSVEVKSMTGARSENSVLFSLNNLQALATGGGAAGGGGGAAAAPKPGYASSQSEGSGLIDIRAMAAQTLSANSFPAGLGSKPDELPLVNEAPLFSPVAPAVLMPISEPSGMPKWVWAVVGVGGVMVVGMVAVIVWVLRAPPAPPQVTPPQPSSGPVASAGGEPPKASPQVTAPPSAPQPGGDSAAGKAAAKDPEPAGAEAEKRRKSKDKDRGGDKDKDKVAVKGPAPKEATPSAPPPPEPAVEKKPKQNKPKDDLDALLDSATGGSGSGKPKGGGEKKDAPEQLSMDVIKSGLKGVNVQSCNQSPGTYIVKMTIGRNGRVSDASVPGKSGDATADCVVRAVKSAKFPEFTGDPQSLSYPFILR